MGGYWEIGIMQHIADRYQGETRQHNLAVWMLRRGARTHTIMKWTHLPRHRIKALSRRYRPNKGDLLRRGISPSQAAFFGSSLLIESSSTALAALLIAMGAIPDRPIHNARATWPNVHRGENLMWAYELYLAKIAEPPISLERAVLLAIELAEGRSLFLSRCSTCPLFTLVDRQGAQHDQCAECRDRQGRLGPGGSSPQGSARKSTAILAPA